VTDKYAASPLAVKLHENKKILYKEIANMSYSSTTCALIIALIWPFAQAYFYCAFTHLSEPVNLTATSVMKMCRGLPSAVPRCSVEINRGPAFL